LIQSRREGSVKGRFSRAFYFRLAATSELFAVGLIGLALLRRSVRR
jgi:hypothetical protein